MKKLLRLDDFTAGGRHKDDIYDLLGLRVVVQPHDAADVHDAPAECDAQQACYRVQVRVISRMMTAARPHPL